VATGRRGDPDRAAAPPTPFRIPPISASVQPMNDAPTPPTIDPDILALHQAVVTLDTHIDIPWPNGAAAFEDGPRKVDMPKMVRGGLSAGCFVAYVPQATRTPANEDAAFSRAIAMLEHINALGRTEAGISVRVTTTADAVEAAKRDGVIAIIPVVENGFAVGTDLSRIARFRALGARYLTLTHNGHNAIGDSCNPRRDLGDREIEHGGLSDLGKAVVRELNRVGMLVDVAHVSRDTMQQAAEVSATPIVSTHSCVSALCDHSRNMTDWQLDIIRDVKGVIQITAVSAFLRPNARPEDVTVADFCDHIDHAVKRIGIDHVGISSDFDGGGWFRDWRNAGDSANLTAELVRRGYDRGAIEKLWGGNFLRVMRVAEQAAA
jgi:membrane dipeptidase